LRPNADDVYAIAFSPDSTRIVSGGHGGETCVCTVPEGDKLFALEGHSKTVRSVAYSPNGQYIVSASFDKSVRIWNADTGEALATLIGHEDEVLSVAYAPDGRSVVSGGADSTIHVWDVEAVLSPPSRDEQEPLAMLGSAIPDNGWLVGPSGELLLWLPLDYRGHVQLLPCSMVIGLHRVVLTAENGLYWGDKWKECWRGAA